MLQARRKIQQPFMKTMVLKETRKEKVKIELFPKRFSLFFFLLMRLNFPFLQVLPMSSLCKFFLWVLPISSSYKFFPYSLTCHLPSFLSQFSSLFIHVSFSWKFVLSWNWKIFPSKLEVLKSRGCERSKEEECSPSIPVSQSVSKVYILYVWTRN